VTGPAAPDDDAARLHVLDEEEAEEAWRHSGWTPVAAPVVLRPSLLAALDTVVKVAGVLFFFTAPLLVPALFNGGPISLTAAFVGLQGTNLYIAVLFAFLPAVRLAFTRYELDEEGIRVTTQILARSEKRVPWEKVTALRHRRTVVDLLVGIERIDVVAYGERGATLHLVGLRGARTIRDQVAVQMRRSATAESLFRSD
jgi:uncharacterized membrane protein YdbT with pleckstrin-like domain